MSPEKLQGWATTCLTLVGPFDLQLRLKIEHIQRCHNARGCAKLLSSSQITTTYTMASIE